MDIEFAVVILGVGCYVVSSLLAAASLLGFRASGERVALILMGLGGAALAGVLISRGLRPGSIPAFNRFDAFTCYGLAISAAYLLWSAYRYTRGIAGILIPYATILLLCGVPALRQTGGAPAPGQGVLLTLHVMTAYAAFGLFTLASLSAVAYLMQDSNLKHKRFGVVWERLPSLGALDHIMSRLVGVAFLLLTVSIVLGFVLVHKIGGGDAWLTDPKIAATVAMWILLAVFVHMRASADRHGRGVALVAVCGLACLLFVFVGAQLVAPTVHSFMQVGLGVNAP